MYFLIKLINVSCYVIIFIVYFCYYVNFLRKMKNFLFYIDYLILIKKGVIIRIRLCIN